MSDIKNMTVEETEIYAEFLRRRIIDAVKKNGGHLSSNLGAVEIILAMHRVFDAERDKFLFDVGHQAYTHKMLTGRLGDFDRLRQSDGLSGFPSPFESRFDAFVAGHSSTSLSLACGFLRAKKLKGGDYNIIALVGDGAMTGGMVYEALNDLRTIGGKVIIALNDNGCPYGEDGARVSGFADYLNDIKNKKVSKPFEEYGIDYMGVVNGHDVSKLTEAFEEAAQNERSVIVHIVTKKGK
ncbi:MAG: 1-deoxy-D-xylulose-5-phosphate synthase, partial [Clostridiales bacterium]|nr:1-deoxy-D-xylulose-5-phosphate synthase [Clostridiales bacterium]